VDAGEPFSISALPANHPIQSSLMSRSLFVRHIDPDHSVYMGQLGLSTAEVLSGQQRLLLAVS
jgi:hypothetical protein